MLIVEKQITPKSNFAGEGVVIDLRGGSAMVGSNYLVCVSVNTSTFQTLMSRQGQTILLGEKYCKVCCILIMGGMTNLYIGRIKKCPP